MRSLWSIEQEEGQSAFITPVLGTSEAAPQVSLQLWASHHKKDIELLENKGSRAGEGSREWVPWGIAEGAGVLQPDEEKAQERPYCSLQSPERRLQPAGISLFSQGTRDGIRGNGLKLGQGRLWFDIRRTFFPKRVVKHWNMLPKEMDSPSLEEFKKWLNVALSVMV